MILSLPVCKNDTESIYCTQSKVCLQFLTQEVLTLQSMHILSKTVLSSEAKHSIEKRWVRVRAISQKKLQQRGVCDRRVRALFYLTIDLDINQSWPEQ